MGERSAVIGSGAAVPATAGGEGGGRPGGGGGRACHPGGGQPGGCPGGGGRCGRGGGGAGGPPGARGAGETPRPPVPRRLPARHPPALAPPDGRQRAEPLS